MLLTALSAGTGCFKQKPQDSEVVYAKAQKLLTRGDLVAAEKTALEGSSQLANHDTEWWWKFQILRANVLLRQGHNEQVLTLLSANLPPAITNSDVAIEQAIVRGIAEARLGRMDDAIRLLDQAQQLSSRTHSRLQAKVFTARGVVDLERDDLIHADQMFRQSHTSAREIGDTYQESSALLNLGVVALQREHFDEAVDFSRMAAESAHTIAARAIEEKSRGNIAFADYSLGNFEEALNEFREAQREAKSLGSPNDEMEWLNNAGLSLYRLGDYQQAEACYKGALQIAESIEYQQEVIEAHVALASLYIQVGRLEEASRHDQVALTIAQASGRTLDEMDALYLKSLIYAKQGKPEEALKILTSLETNSILQPSQRWPVEGTMANLYAETNNDSSADKWYRQSITTFETQRGTIKKEESKLPFSTHADQLYDDYVRFLVDHKRTDEALQWLDLGRARTLEEGLGVASPDFKTAIRKSFNARSIAGRLHGTILVYSLAPKESYLWAVNSTGTHFFKLPPQEEINAHVKNYQRAILGSRDPIAEAYVSGMALYRLLVEPAAGLIPKGSPVFIIPNGSLSTLNFETVLVPGSGIHYWIEDATITNASSLKLLSAFHPEKHAKNPKKLLLIGNPISPDRKFPDLPNASSEVANVAGHFPAEEESVFTQKQALPSTYSDSAPGGYSLIHFVAHGTSSSASPLDSAIVLTRDPANPDSFKLYARDVMAHPLQADLVTISACYGSGSRVYGGEGLVGLSWAFLRAGSHYVIGSLWQVSDSAAPQIMDRMYSDIAAGVSPDAALRNAKLSMIHTQNVFRKPLYWATFQLYGGA